MNGKTLRIAIWSLLLLVGLATSCSNDSGAKPENSVEAIKDPVVDEDEIPTWDESADKTESAAATDAKADASLQP